MDRRLVKERTDTRIDGSKDGQKYRQAGGEIDGRKERPTRRNNGRDGRTDVIDLCSVDGDWQRRRAR